MRRLLEAAGVDYVQWRALSRAYIRIEYTALRGAYGPKAALEAALQQIVTAVGLTILGLPAALVIWLHPDFFLATTAMVTLSAWFVGVLALLGHVATITSPADYAILGHRPVSSRTYLAVRGTSVLVNAAEVAFFIGYLPVVAVLTRRGGSVLAALAAIAAIAAAASAATLAAVAFYSWLLVTFSPARMNRVLLYVQLIFGLGILAVYGGIVWWLIDGIEIGLRGSLAKTVSTMWFPATWFASYIEIARGQIGVAELSGAALSVVSILLLTLSLRGRLGTDYSAHVAQGAQASEPVRTRALPGWVRLLRDETRAVILVARGLWRGDMTFRTSLVGDLVLFAGLLVAMGLMDPPPDPFVAGSGRNTDGAAGFFIPYAVAYFPSSLRQQFVSSATASSAWVFFTTPGHPARLVTAARDLIALFIISPMTLVIAAFFVHAFGRVDHALIHALFLGCASYLVLQLTILLKPEIPFSVPADTRRPRPFPSLGTFAAIAVGVIASSVATNVAFRTTIGTAVAFVVVSGLSAAVAALTRRRIERRGFVHYG